MSGQYWSSACTLAHWELCNQWPQLSCFDQALATLHQTLPNHSSLPLSFPLKMFSQVPSGLSLKPHAYIIISFICIAHKIVTDNDRCLLHTIQKRPMDGHDRARTAACGHAFWDRLISRMHAKWQLEKSSGACIYSMWWLHYVSTTSFHKCCCVTVDFQHFKKNRSKPYYQHFSDLFTIE